MIDILIAVYALALSPGDWLPTLVFGVVLTGLLLWALWLNFYYWRR